MKRKTFFFITFICLFFYFLFSGKKESKPEFIDLKKEFKCPPCPECLSTSLFMPASFHENFNSKVSLSQLEKVHQYLHVVPISHSLFIVHDDVQWHQVDGDVAQQYVVEKILHLEQKCKNDPSTVVVDVGSFAGDFALIAASFGCQVYIFEPHPFRYSLIAASVALNGLEGNTYLYNNAICSSKTGIKIVLDNGLTRQSISGNVSIPCVTLDQIFPSHDIFLLKVDVEGYESDVLFNSSSKLLDEKRIENLIVEYTPFWLDEGRGPWLPFLQEFNDQESMIFALHRRSTGLFGPILHTQYESFHDTLLRTHIQTDLFIYFNSSISIPSEFELWHENVSLL